MNELHEVDGRLYQGDVPIEAPKQRPRRVKQVVPGAPDNVLDLAASREAKEEEDEGALVATYTHLAQRAVALPLVRVPCAVPGFTHLSVVYNCGIPFLKRNAFPRLEDKREDEDDSAYLARYMAWWDKAALWMTLFIVEVEGWDVKDVYTGEPLPVPTKSDPSAYRTIWEQNDMLATWLAFTGYDKALERLTGEASGRSSTP